MFDNITLIKNNLTENEKLQIIDKNNLQSLFDESHQIRTYHNTKNKNLTGGILIKIVDNKIRIEGSIHKYFHYLKFGSLENYTVFTMSDFLETLKNMFINYQIEPSGFYIVNYEIGLNIFIGNYEPLDFIKKVKSIGNLDGTQRELYVSPNYKNNRFLTTLAHKDNTIVFRVYDKNFERIDKGKKNNILPCIRIETQHKRQRNISLIEFCKPANLLIIQNKFFAEWNKLNFDKEISAPPRTGQSKKDIAKNIILDGSIVTLKNLEERRNQLTPKIFRNQKEFILNWENIKFDYYLIECEIMPLWANFYTTTIQLVTNHTFKI